MTVIATLPLGETVALDDVAPCLPLLVAPSPLTAGWRGLAPWDHQGASYLVLPHAPQFGDIHAADAEGRLGGGPAGKLMKGFHLAKNARSTPKLGARWLIASPSSATADSAWGHHARDGIGVVPAVTLTAHTHALVWLTAAQAPTWKPGAAWFPAVIGYSPSVDAEYLFNSATLATRLRLNYDARRGRPWKGYSAVWGASVPWRGRFYSDLGAPIGRIYAWTPTDTAPGTDLLWPDGWAPV